MIFHILLFLLLLILFLGYTTNGFDLNLEVINFNYDKEFDYSSAILNNYKEFQHSLINHDNSLLSLTSTLSSSCNISQIEYDALKSLYQSTNGGEWIFTDTNETQWNFPSNLNEPCATNSTWYGLTCIFISNDICSITQIILDSSNLNGSLPDNLDNFANLTVFSVNKNLLSSSIPTSMFNIVKLIYLGLSYNNLNNTIPSNINNLVNLQYLFLNVNSLSGNIPNVNNLVNLQYLVLNSNSLSGNIPSMNNVVNLKYLVLYNNKLSGTIPNSVYFLTNLVVIDLHSNKLNGVISSNISNLYKLHTLNLCINNFESTIPSSLCGNTNLRYLLLNNNQLKNEIPTNIGALTKLITLSLYNNQLTNTIPESMYSLVYLVQLDISSNKIGGTISSSIGNFVNLNSLHFENNMIGGSIPSTIQYLTQLQTFIMYNNELSNSIPTTIGNLRNLKQLMIYSNNLNGLLPTSICSLTNLTVIFLYDNELSGSICDNFGNLINLITIDLHGNSIVGTIPISIKNLRNLNVFALYNNQLTGSIPPELGYVKSLTSILLHNNKLSGNVNVFINNLVSLNELLVNNNMLTGTVDFLKTYQQIEILDISYNYFTGTLFDMTSFTKLKIFFCSDNYLDGNLDNLINSTSNNKLTNLDFSNNHFNGSLPMDFFNLKSLKTFAAGSNCISTTLSPSICNCTSLNSLILNGLMTAPPCRNLIFPYMSDITTYYSDKQGIITNNGIAIPDCLFNMKQLTTLQLSGNIIKGTIPNNLVINNKLQDLALSNNQFEGSIPNEILNRKWDYLNLGHNKLNGILSSVMPSVNSNASLLLDNNRLSGQIPHSLVAAENISVLSGNIFSCPIINSISELPHNDKPYVTVYKCGSDSLYTSYIISLLLILVFVVLKTDIFNLYNEYEVVERNNSLKGFFCFTLPELWSKYVNILNDVSINVLSISPLSNEKLNNNQNNKVDFQFSNLASLFDFSKRLFNLLKYCLYLLLLWIPISLVLKNHYGTHSFSYGFILSIINISGEPAAITIMILLMFSMIIFYIILNMNFPVIEIVKEKRDTDFILKIAIMFLVLIFNFLCMSALNVYYIYATLNYSSIVVNIIQLIVAFVKTVWKFAVLPRAIKILSQSLIKDYIKNYNSSELIVFQSFVEIMNILIIPCFATAIFNPNCFYYAFFSQELIESSYTFLSPCVADINENYNVCLLNGGVLQTRYTTFDAPFLYSYECSSALVTTYSNIYIFMAFMLVFQACNFGPILVSKIKNKFGKKIPPLLVIFQKDRFIINIASFLVVSVTVGMVMPTLGIFTCLCLYLYVHLTLTHLGIMYTKLVDEESKLKFMNMIENDTKGVLDSANYSFNLFLLPLMGVFYSFFVFDTLGDVIGSAKALWVLFVLTLLPFAFKFYSFILASKQLEQTKYIKEQIDIELTDIKKSANPLHALDKI